MSRTRIAATALCASALIVSGCGSSTKSSSQTTSAATPAASTSTGAGEPSHPSGTLTRAQLISKGDEICYRLNARRQSTSIGHTQDYERVVPQLSAYEIQGATELSLLTPPPPMAHAWQEIVTDSRVIAEVTGHFRHYGASHKEQHPYDVMIGNAINQLVAVAKREGFKECSRFL